MDFQGKYTKSPKTCQEKVSRYTERPIVGPDNIKKHVLKNYLTGKLGISENELINPASSREFGTMQLLQVLEREIVKNSDLTSKIEMIKELRIEADHKILTETGEVDSYTWKFSVICEEVSVLLMKLGDGILHLRSADC